MIALVGDRPVVVTGRVVRLAKPRDEPYECIDEPDRFIGELRRSNVQADVFTFSQEVSERVPRYGFPLEWEGVSVLTVTTYEHWWKHQINDKTRNMVRKAQQRGVEIRAVAFSDDLVRAIAEIYNERVIIQGKPNRHYAQDFDTMRRTQGTFLERSDFVGAYCRDELIGFFKLVRGRNVASLMSIIAKTAHRDKATTNALLSRAVEMCAERGIPSLHYGAWSRRSLGDFKRHHAFERVEVPRYFVPLTRRGRWLLALALHRPLSERLPERWWVALAGLRDRWNAIRFRDWKA